MGSIMHSRCRRVACNDHDPETCHTCHMRLHELTHPSGQSLQSLYCVVQHGTSTLQADCRPEGSTCHGTSMQQVCATMLSSCKDTWYKNNLNVRTVQHCSLSAIVPLSKDNLIQGQQYGNQGSRCKGIVTRKYSTFQAKLKI